MTNKDQPMNREELRNQAAGRRNPAEDTAPKVTWNCAFCGKDFVHENAFMRHTCKEKERHEELRSPLGQAAYAYYAKWMKCQRHSVPPIETFGHSRYYTAFTRFAEFAAKVRLPSVDRYIELMASGEKKNRVPPELWCRDAVYSTYLRSYDEARPPIVQFADGLKVLEDLALELKVPLSDVFPAIGVETLEDMISRRVLTFWLLMASSRFRQYLLTLSTDDRERLQRALNAGAVLERINQEAAQFREFAAVAKDVGL